MDDDLTRLAGDDSAAPPSSARFEVGALFAGRFRIVGPLGRGGMGEVYRADDLKLDQAVALKLLPAELEREPARLAQFHNEVRVARQVSHRNVCRTYDIGEADGRHFLTMEYVDGEDLASLLRRIGRFPQDRAVEVARQICAGLAAAHERGVLHRDLKPANIMIDGRGHVRITDFGLASAAGTVGNMRSGTPAYMAPEQLAGRDVSTRSDIYSLGLVLFELFTGRRVFEASNLNELIELHKSGDIRTPSSVVRDLDPTIERAILRCLERDPANRPPSALAVSASLPGGSPLAAALAAGETPSPEMVAAAGDASALKPAVGLAGVALAVGGLLATAWAADRVLMLHQIPITRSTDSLRDRAREILEQIGYTDAPRDSASGWSISNEYLGSTIGRAERWRALASGRVPALLFWHRTSPLDMIPLTQTSMASNDPPMTVAGMRVIVLDPQGRLVQFRAIPPSHDAPAPLDARAGAQGRPPIAPDWARLFAAAALPAASFRSVEPEWTPRDYADTRAAWEGAIPELPGKTLRVEAAAYRGQPTFFRLLGSWTAPAAAAPAQSTTDVFALLSSFVRLALLVGGALLARHNLRSGRGDPRGAAKTASVVFGSLLIAWGLSTPHFTTEVDAQLAPVAYTSIVLWLLYLALEPYVRRFWPEFLIGWTRLVSGRIRDPQVGRDILIGVIGGVAVALVIMLHGVVPQWFGWPPADPMIVSPSPLAGPRWTLVAVLRTLRAALLNAFEATIGVVVARMLVRRTWAAIAVVMVVFFPVAITGMFPGTRPALDVPFTIITIALMLVVLLNYGLLALSVTFLVFLALTNLPVTADPASAYAGESAWLLGSIAALAAFGYYASRGAEPVFGRPWNIDN